MIPPERLIHIPEEYREQHSFCFWLHDLLVQVMSYAESAGIADVKIKFSTPEEMQAFRDADDPIAYFIDKGDMDTARRITINQTIIPLIADMLHFIYGGLEALEKRKFTVAFALFRKPFRQNLLFLTWLFADEVDFFSKMHVEPSSLDKNVTPEKKKELLDKAIAKLRVSEVLAADVVYGMVFDKKNVRGLGHYFDKAIHLVTHEAAIQTEQLNLNFVFKSPHDTDLYDGIYYILAYLQMYLLSLVLQIFAGMTTIRDSYFWWLRLVTLGSFEALFGESSSIAGSIGELFADVLKCITCGEQIVISKSNAPGFLAAEVVGCDSCGTVQGFPFFWLTTQLKVQDIATKDIKLRPFA
jgi:hypothetical protein